VLPVNMCFQYVLPWGLSGNTDSAAIGNVQTLK